MPVIDKSQWIPTEWTRIGDLATFNSGFTIRRMVSPFYEGERFAAMDGESFCLAKDGEKEYVPMPSSRDDDFYKRCRFDSFDEAVSAVVRYEAKNGKIRR